MQVDTGVIFLFARHVAFIALVARALLPAGWMLTASSIPATVTTTKDGRIRLDFVNPRPDEIAVLIKAKKRQR